ncbi:hypothetical protein F4811DRAFT_547715 [Daldinia bambusicola]|nr:hypothetical protein F4811DRAFT_547715 [Daldinia bambusicola]
MMAVVMAIMMIVMMVGRGLELGLLLSLLLLLQGVAANDLKGHENPVSGLQVYSFYPLLSYDSPRPPRTSQTHQAPRGVHPSNLPSHTASSLKVPINTDQAGST